MAEQRPAPMSASSPPTHTPPGGAGAGTTSSGGAGTNLNQREPLKANGAPISKSQALNVGANVVSVNKGSPAAPVAIASGANAISVAGGGAGGANAVVAGGDASAARQPRGSKGKAAAAAAAGGGPDAAPAVVAGGGGANKQQQQNGYAVWVGNLPSSVTSKVLSSTFEVYGPVKQSIVRLSPINDQMRFGFVFFEQEKSMHLAVNESGSLACSGSKTTVRYKKAQRPSQGGGGGQHGGGGNQYNQRRQNQSQSSPPRGPPQYEFPVYIPSIPEGTDMDRVAHALRRFGEILSVSRPANSNGVVIYFRSEEAQRRAVNAGSAVADKRPADIRILRHFPRRDTDWRGVNATDATLFNEGAFKNGFTWASFRSIAFLFLRIHENHTRDARPVSDDDAKIQRVVAFIRNIYCSLRTTEDPSDLFSVVTAVALQVAMAMLSPPFQAEKEAAEILGALFTKQIASAFVALPKDGVLRVPGVFTGRGQDLSKPPSEWLSKNWTDDRRQSVAIDFRRVSVQFQQLVQLSIADYFKYIRKPANARSPALDELHDMARNFELRTNQSQFNGNDRGSGGGRHNHHNHHHNNYHNNHNHHHHAGGHGGHHHNHFNNHHNGGGGGHGHGHGGHVNHHHHNQQNVHHHQNAHQHHHQHGQHQHQQQQQQHGVAAAAAAAGPHSHHSQHQFHHPNNYQRRDQQMLMQTQMVPSQVATSGALSASGAAGGLAPQQQQQQLAPIGALTASTANGGPASAGVQQPQMPSSAMIQHQLQQGAQVQSVMMPSQQGGVSMHAHGGQMSFAGQGGGQSGVSMTATGANGGGGGPQGAGGPVDEQLVSRMDALHLPQS